MTPSLLGKAASKTLHRSARFQPDATRRRHTLSRRATAAGEPRPDLDRRRLFSDPTATNGRADLVRALSGPLAVAIAVETRIETCPDYEIDWLSGGC